MMLTIDISDDDARLIEQLLESFGDGELGDNTHGKLDIPKLAAMLLEDAALAWRRPGSWEGFYMGTCLCSHGYEPRHG